MRRTAIGCAIVCLWSCGQQAEELAAQQAKRRASQNPQDAQAQAEWIGARFVADAGGEGGAGAKEGPVELRHDRIEKELKTIDEDATWGTYYEGGALTSVTLSIAPKSGATYTWYGCLGLYDANHGDIVEVDGRNIRLDLAVDPEHNNRWWPAFLAARYMSDEWCVVDWGDRRFMIPSSRMIPFCNDVNSGGSVDFPCRTVGDGEKRNGSMADGDWWLPNELPQVPAQYRPFLLANPIRAEVQETGNVAKVEESLYRVVATINVGRSAGLLPGMTLRPESGGQTQAEVVAVQDSTAQVRMHLFHRGSFPRPGSILTTGPRR